MFLNPLAAYQMGRVAGGSLDPSDWAQVRERVLALGSGKITVVAPTLAGGSLRLNRGDAYRVVDGRALRFDIENVSTSRLGNVFLIIGDTPELRVPGAFEVTSAGVSCIFELSAMQTQALAPRSVKYWLRATTISNDSFDLAEGDVRVHTGSAQ